MNSRNGAASNDYNPNKSYQVDKSPSDSVSSLSFSPQANILLATSWDNLVRCWHINLTRIGGADIISSCVPGPTTSHAAPVLCSAWRCDGAAVFSGGCDNQVKLWDLGSGGYPSITVGMHDAPVKEVAWIPGMNLVVTGSWDSTLKYWDMRQANPIHTQHLPGRFRALSVNYPLMVVGSGDRELLIFDLQNPQNVYKTITSRLRHQTRCVASFPDKKGFLVGSIEGRVAIHHIEDSDKVKNFAFRCHRGGEKNHQLYSVSSLSFHPVYNTLATTGSDGMFCFWDIKSRQRLKITEKCNQPIPCGTFNHDGSIFAYSSCYDWSKGAENHNPATAKTYIFLHLPQDDLKPKPEQPSNIGNSDRPTLIKATKSS